MEAGKEGKDARERGRVREGEGEREERQRTQMEPCGWMGRHACTNCKNKPKKK